MTTHTKSYKMPTFVHKTKNTLKIIETTTTNMAKQDRKSTATVAVNNNNNNTNNGCKIHTINLHFLINQPK